MSIHNCDWLESAGWLRIHPVPASDRERMQLIGQNLLMMCRADFAADLAYARLADAVHTTGTTGYLVQWAEAHAFIVSAHLAWVTLGELGRHLRGGFEPRRAVQNALRTYKDVRLRCETARHHIEHITERLEQGRSSAHGHGKRMTAKQFRQSVGTVTRTTISFGGEKFDLAEQMNALVRIRTSVARTIEIAAEAPAHVRVVSVEK